MKKLITAFVLCSLLLVAAKPVPKTVYALVWLRTDATLATKQALKQLIENVTGMSYTSSLDDLPQWRKAADHSVVGWVECFNKSMVGTGRPPRNITEANFETWKNNNLPPDERAKVVLDITTNPEQTLKDKGMEYVPGTGPQVDHSEGQARSERN